MKIKDFLKMVWHDIFVYNYEDDEIRYNRDLREDTEFVNDVSKEVQKVTSQSD